MASLNSDVQTYHELDYFTANQITGEYFGIYVANNSWVLSEWQQSVWDGAIAVLDAYLASLPEVTASGTVWNLSNADHQVGS